MINFDKPVFARVSFFDNLLLTRHLAIMLKSGIPLPEALASLKDQTKNPSLKDLLTNVLKEINNGHTLETALSKYPSVFSDLYLSLIGIGEKSGNLEENLEYLSDQLKKTYEFNNKIKGAMLYPALILSATFIIGMGMSLFVLPQLVQLFTSLGVELPLTTKILLFIATLMKNYGLSIILGFIGLGTLTYSLFQTPTLRPRWQAFLLGLPVFGILLQNIQLSSIFRNLGVMLQSGLPLPQALRTEYHALDNPVYKSYLKNFIKEVEKGHKLSYEMEKADYKFIPQIASKMVTVGERTGRLEETFLYLSDFFEEEVDNTTKNLSTILEPILLLIIGAVVAFVAFALITPIYQLTGSINVHSP